MSLPALALRRGLMQQQQSDAFSHSVLDTVLLGRTPYRIGTAWDAIEDRDAALFALARTGLSDKVHADITRLSGGERQRVALAALLAQAPDLMLMDEPTSHQDVGQQLAIMRIARELTQQHAIVASCHDINLAARFATHVLVLGEGQHWMGKAAEVLTPEILEQAFGCGFSLRGGTIVAE
jgi:iron complex transport system ATP-binding protein